MQKSRGLRFPPRGTKEKKLASARANLFERKELTARMKATGFQGSPREKNDTFRESKVKSGWKKIPRRPFVSFPPQTINLAVNNYFPGHSRRVSTTSIPRFQI